MMYAILYRSRDGSTRGAVLSPFTRKLGAWRVAVRLNELCPRYRHWVVYLRPGLDISAIDNDARNHERAA